MSDKKLEILESRVKEAMESCPQAKEVLETLFPETKQQKWVDVSGKCELKHHVDGMNFRLHLPEDRVLCYFVVTTINLMGQSNFKFENGRLYHKE